MGNKGQTGFSFLQVEEGNQEVIDFPLDLNKSRRLIVEDLNTWHKNFIGSNNLNSTLNLEDSKLKISQ